MIWNIKKIDIFTEKYKNQKILNFEGSQKTYFPLFK